MNSVQYMTPSREWVSEKQACRMLMSLADRLAAADCHDRAHWVRFNWQRTAARPSLWAELERVAS